VVPGHWAEVAVGIFSGQAMVLMARVLAEPGSGGLWPLGILLLALYSLLALLGAGLGSALRRRAAKSGRGESTSGS
jgi:Na+/H+-dicarboxylate symporter